MLSLDWLKEPFLLLCLLFLLGGIDVVGDVILVFPSLSLFAGEPLPQAVDVHCEFQPSSQSVEGYEQPRTSRGLIPFRGGLESPRGHRNKKLQDYLHPGCWRLSPPDATVLFLRSNLPGSSCWRGGRGLGGESEGVN